MFLLLGAVFVGITLMIKPRFFWFFAGILPVVWILMIVAKFIGHGANEANRWILGFQPSEFAKLSLIVFVAFLLSWKRNQIPEKVSFNWIWVLTALTCAIILLDNLSTAIILYGVVGVLLFIGQISFKRVFIYFSTAIAAVALMFAFIWFSPEKAKDVGLKRAVTWVERIKTYKQEPEITKNNIPDDVFQATQAKIAVARGGIFGKFPGNGQQRNFLPQAYSDFIYAIIIEETGIVGGIFVLFLYVFLFIRAGTIAGRCTSIFPKLLVIGSALMIVIQALINMAVSVSLLPVTGQPLPLISKGGTSQVVTCIFIGIILSVSYFENPRGVRQEAEFEAEFEEERRLSEEEDDLEAQLIY